jgi:hypothetical protein
MATMQSNTPVMLSSLPENGVPNNKDENNPAMSFDEDTEDDKSLTGGVKPWDEGGISDCGYGDTVHTTLMNVGETIHHVVGAPTSRHVVKIQKSIGNWFQELSYATRDLLRGDHSSTLQKDTADAIHTVMTGGGLPDDDEISDSGEKKIDEY